MSEQIFISYRRVGGDITAKLICETLKARGYTVFYDFDSINNGRFDERIFSAIEDCNDFLLVLSKGSLDNCENNDDWVRWEIRHALKYNKNIVPLFLPGFEFPQALPFDMADVQKFNGVNFVIDYFDSVMETLIERIISQPAVLTPVQPEPEKKEEPRGFFASLFGKKSQPVKAEPKKTLPKIDDSSSRGLNFERFGDGYICSGLGSCIDKYVVIPKLYRNIPVIGIGKMQSWGCAPVRIMIPNTVTEIGNDAFKNLSSLESVNVPSSVRKIGREAFMRDMINPVEEIVYDGTMEMWEKIRFAPDWIKLNNNKNSLVYCVDGIIDLKERAKAKK